MRIEVEIEVEVFRSKAAIDLELVLATRSHFPFRPNGRGFPKVVPMSGGFPGFFPQRALRKTGNPLFNPRAFFIPLLYTYRELRFCEHGK